MQRLLAREAEGLSVEWVSSVRNGWVTVHAKGDDSEAFANLLKKKYGEIPVRMEKLTRWDVLRGYVTGAGRVGYGVYIDVGVLEPSLKDALYPLHRMRAQLSEGRQMSAREILAENALVDGFPIMALVTGLDAEKVSVELSDASREEFDSRREHPWDGVVAVGLTREQAVNVIRRMKLEENVVEVESHSIFVQSIVLRVGTEAPGIIAKIGRQLRGVSLTAYTAHKKIE